MNILVTGGFGYIGGRLVHYLIEKYPNIEIIVAERISCAMPAWAHNIRYLPLELLSKESVKECVAKAKPDCIIHLAALNEIDCVNDPKLADKVNRAGTEFLAESAVENGVKNFIYFSTFHVYGKAEKSLISEEVKPEPSHPYAVTHLQAEHAVMDLQRKGMNTIIFRLSNSYGYPMDINVNRWTLLVNDLSRQAVTIGRMHLASSGRQKRDFISLGNVTEAVRYFIFDIPNAWGDGLYNLGSGQTVSVLDMAQYIENLYYEKYGRRAELILGSEPYKKTETIIDFEYSVSKLKNTGFTMQNDMENEILKTMDVCEHKSGESCI
jgi:UDP-glucose 4-epimerase